MRDELSESDLKFDIQFSCPKKWESLKDEDVVSKFCNQCSRKVYDFSSLKKDQLEELFDKNESICAKIPLNDLSSFLTPFQKMLFALVFCFSGTLFHVEFVFSQDVQQEFNQIAEFTEVRGRVLSFDSTEVVVGANVLISFKDEIYTTVTDLNGDFTIHIPKVNDTIRLEVRYLGEYKILTFTIQNKEKMDLGKIVLLESIMLGVISPKKIEVVGMIVPNRVFNQDPNRTTFSREEINRYIGR